LGDISEGIIGLVFIGDNERLYLAVSEGIN